MRLLLACWFLFMLGVGLSSCGGETPTPTPLVSTPTAVPSSTPVPPTNSPAAPTNTALPTQTPTPIAVNMIVDALKTAGLPIGEVTIYTAESDPNHLLGRPNQYTAKASWHDTRLPQPQNATLVQVSDGGGIEAWPDADGAQNRMKYLQSLGKQLPIAVEHNFQKGALLLRVSKDLTPEQADEYRKAFEAISVP
jgi:hypothetical protein